MTSEERTAMSAEGRERDLARGGDAHGGMEDLGFDDLGAPDDAVRGYLDALQGELVTPVDPAVRTSHLAAMTSEVPAATGWALRFRRARIRHALAAAGLKVALVSTAAAAGTGALAVPGDVLPPAVQRAVASTASGFGLDLPSPDDEEDVAPLDELEDDGDELPTVETPDPGENAVRDEDDEPEDDDEDEDTGDGPDPDSEDEASDAEISGGEVSGDTGSGDEPSEDAGAGTGTTATTTGERDDDEPSGADEPDDEPSVDEASDGGDAEASTDD